MAFAYWIAQAPQSFFPVLNGGDAAILYCFVFLYLAFAGPGPWSIDAMWAEKGLATSQSAPAPICARFLQQEPGIAPAGKVSEEPAAGRHWPLDWSTRAGLVNENPLVPELPIMTV